MLCAGLIFVEPSLHRGKGIGCLRGLDVVCLKRGDGAGGAVGVVVAVLVITVVIAVAAAVIIAGERSAVSVIFLFRCRGSSWELSGENSAPAELHKKNLLLLR